jgi:hypothetical protein
MKSLQHTKFKKITPKSQIKLKTNVSKLGYINTFKLKEKYSNKKKIKSPFFFFLAKQALYLFGFKVRKDIFWFSGPSERQILFGKNKK